MNKTIDYIEEIINEVKNLKIDNWLEPIDFKEK